MNTPHLIEIALLMLAAFLIGCLIGYFLRRMISADAPAPAAAQSEASTSAPSAAASTTTAETSKAEAATKESVAEKAPAKTTASTSAAKKPAAKKPAATKPAAKKPAANKPAAAKKPAAKSAAAAKPAAAKKAPAKKAAAAGDGKPATLSGPRDGKKDDLKNIKGIGPKIEGILNGMGIYHFDQVASWGRKEVKWVDEELSFKGRIDREKWIAQAKKLAKDS